MRRASKYSFSHVDSSHAQVKQRLVSVQRFLPSPFISHNADGAQFSHAHTQLQEMMDGMSMGQMLAGWSRWLPPVFVITCWVAKTLIALSLPLTSLRWPFTTHPCAPFVFRQPPLIFDGCNSLPMQDAAKPLPFLSHFPACEAPFAPQCFAYLQNCFASKQLQARRWNRYQKQNIRTKSSKKQAKQPVIVMSRVSREKVNKQNQSSVVMNRQRQEF